MISRRGLLSTLAAASAAWAVPLDRALARDIDDVKPTLQRCSADTVWVRRDGASPNEMLIRFRKPDTRELDHDGVLALSWFWRDIRDHGQGVWIEPRLFDVLSWMQVACSTIAGADKPIQLVSGYRTPERNRRIEGAARRSMHIFGKAADITVPGFTPLQVGQVAAAAGAGGIGLYSGFTHVDVGRVRAWQGR